VEEFPESGKAPNVAETGALPIVFLGPIRPETLPELRWVVDGFMTEPGVTFISGVAKVGKSQLALRLAIALASGRPFLGRFDVTSKRRVLYVTGEDWWPNVYRRVQTHALDAGFTEAETRAEVLPNLQVVPVCGLRLDSADQVTLLTGALETLKYDALIIDPLARFHQLDEDKASGMAPLLRTFREMGDSRSLIVVHHEGKRQEAGFNFGPLSHRGRGTSAFADLHDNYIALSRIKGGFRIEREHKYESPPEPLDVEVTWANGTVHWEVGEPETAANLATRVAEFVAANPGCSTKQVKDGVRGRADSIVAALDESVAKGVLRMEMDGQAKRWTVP
jgi:hypothetical protein